MKLVMHLLVMY